MSREMKDSGISWIGYIPIGWNIDAIGSLYYPRNEKVSDKDYPPLSVGKMGVVPQLETAAKTDDGDNRKLVKIGDFAINSRSDRRGSCGISSYDGSVSLINTILTPRIEMNPQYYNWLFHTESFADEFYKWGHGIVDDLWTTRWQEMKRISIAVPPLPEQKAIADYLDKKCVEIDELISLQEKIIDELTSYKQSIITEAVTKGLNHDIPMKDSGIDWIGKIPKGWDVSKISRHYNVQLGKMVQPNQLSENDTLEYYLCAVNLGNNKLKYEPLKQMWISQKERANYSVSRGDLLVVEGGDVASCDLIQIDVDNLFFQNALHRVRTKTGDDLRYLRYFLIAAKGIGYIELICNKATIAHFTKEKFESIPFSRPSISEQQIIADYLDKMCFEIDELISIKQSKIEALKEYKKSIIYECVTGKKDVI